MVVTEHEDRCLWKKRGCDGRLFLSVLFLLFQHLLRTVIDVDVGNSRYYLPSPTCEPFRLPSFFCLPLLFPSAYPPGNPPIAQLPHYRPSRAHPGSHSREHTLARRAAPRGSCPCVIWLAERGPWNSESRYVFSMLQAIRPMAIQEEGRFHLRLS